MNSAHPIVLHLRINVREGRQKDLVAFLNEAVSFYERPGGIRIRILKNCSTPNCFLEIIEYDSSTSYQQDQERVERDEEMKSLLNRWRSLLEGLAQVELYEDLTAEIHAPAPR